MQKGVTSADRIAALLTLPGAVSQSFHLDSLNPGNSGVTAIEEDQYVDVLFGAFLAMLILDELNGDRAEATKLVRSRLAGQTPPCVFTDSDWASIVEPCAWQFLVHREFMAREVQDFEVVRVCIKKTKTAVMDSRTAHAGTEPRSRAGISARGVGCLPMRAGTRRDALPFGCLAPVHPQLGSERP